MSKFHLAQLNIAQMRTPMDDPAMKDFVDNLEGVNKIAEGSPGYVWRLQTDEGDATAIRIFDDDMLLVNMSVWESVEQLKSFVYDSFHIEILKRKKEWFSKFDKAYQVMWWIRAGTEPSIEEAERRLVYLQENAESPYAFSFRQSFPPSAEHLELPDHK